jgi:hypothetical protein
MDLPDLEGGGTFFKDLRGTSLVSGVEAKFFLVAGRK